MHKRVVRLSGAVVTLSIVLISSLPAHARPTDDGWSPGKVMKAIKRFIVKTLGDGILVPRP